MPAFRSYPQVTSLEYKDAFILDRVGVGTVFLEGSAVLAKPNVINVTASPFNAKTDGTNQITAFTAAAAAAVAANKPLLIPGGIFTISNWQPPSGLTVYLEGTLKRPANDVANTTTVFLNNVNNVAFYSNSGVIDGNKSNNTLGANLVFVDNCWEITFEGVKFQAAKGVSDGFGNGLTFLDGQDLIHQTTTSVKNCKFVGNDTEGFAVQRCWNMQIEGNSCSANGASGFFSANFVLPPVANVNVAFIFTGNTLVDNAGAGAVFLGFYTNATSNLNNIIPGHGFEPNRAIVVSNNIAHHNGQYGIAFQGQGASIVGNVCYLNGGTGTTWAGINVTQQGGVVLGNTCDENEYFGIDCGGSLDMEIGPNSCRLNGINSLSGGGIGLNLGACINVNVTGGSYLYNGGVTQGTQISLNAYDGDGGSTGFPWDTSYVNITGARVAMSNSNQFGIALLAAPAKCSVHDCTAHGGDEMKAFVFQVAVGEFSQSGNRHTSSLGRYLLASATNAVIPDNTEQLSITGTTTIATLWPKSQSDYFQAVMAVRMVNRGTGYTSAPAVGFSGGGGTGAAAHSVLANDGSVAFIVIDALGAGYTSAPNITLTGGGGASATAVAIVGAAPLDGSTLRLRFAASCALNNGGGKILAGAATFNATVDDTISLMGEFGNLYELCRSVN